MAESFIGAYQEYCDSEVAGGDLRRSVAAIHRLARLMRTQFPGDFEAFEKLNGQMYRVWKERVGNVSAGKSRRFQTTGSTRSTARTYSFGPHPDLWIQAMWEATRFPLGWRPVVKIEPQLNDDARATVVSDSGGKYQFVVSCGPLRIEIVRDLVETIKNLLRDHPAVSLISVPDTLLYLNAHPDFIDFAIEQRARFNLISQHWEPFYPRRTLEKAGVHINDALGDWTTGLFAYTCKAGFRHMLPTSATVGKDRVNLLNLMPTPELGPGTEDDFFEPQSVSLCPCGLNRLNFRYWPHQSTTVRTLDGELVYDMELAERLVSRYRSIQFVQEGDIILIYYRVDGEMRDEDLLQQYFEGLGFRVGWQPNDCYMVGTKRPAFFRHPS